MFHAKSMAKSFIVLLVLLHGDSLAEGWDAMPQAWSSAKAKRLFFMLRLRQIDLLFHIMVSVT